MADALITRLSNNRQLVVRPLSTSQHYASSNQDSLAAGRTMNVDYVLEGNFQKVGDRLRVTVQLLCIACNGTSRWAASYDETSSDMFHLQDSISQKVAAALTPELSDDDNKRLQMRETANQDAYLAYVKGKFFSTHDTKEDAEKAILFSEHAVRLDPGYAAAWAQLADCYHRLEWYGVPPAEYIPKSKAAAEKALQLDDTVAATHAVLGLIAFQYDWDLRTAAREYQRTLELAPRYLHQWTARYLLVTNQQAAAESVYERFVKEAPFSVAGIANFAQYLFLTGQYDRAAEQVRKTLQLNSSYAPAHELLGLIDEQQGRTGAAAEELERAVDLSHGYIGLGSLGHLDAKLGKRSDLEGIFQEFREQTKQRYVAPFELALVHAGLGENGKALEDLEKGYQERSLSAQSLMFDPRLAGVRRETSFAGFVRRIGLR